MGKLNIIRHQNSVNKSAKIIIPVEIHQVHEYTLQRLVILNHFVSAIPFKI